MTRILAFDTTNEFGSIALISGGEVAAEVPMQSANGFGHLLFGRIAAVLESAGWKLAEIDCLAAAAGPGSFTGVRVGLSAAKGLAEALGKPAAAVSNLAAIAWHGTGALRAALIDARRGQIYGAVYDAQLRLVSPETVATLAEWLPSLPPGPLEFLATDPALMDTARIVPRTLAGAIGHIAGARLAAGETGAPAALDANYVRRSDAELFWRE